jgi:glycosyltransferase involved in cell wall biosynthesis
VGPLLSVITVNLNDRAGLDRTLASVARQSFQDREVIVIDGGSTDGSRDVVRRYASIVTESVSERDRGIYDAQNKGIQRARGTYCLFLNAGDSLASDDALDRLLAGPPQEAIVYGDLIHEFPDGRPRRPYPFPDRPSFEFLMRETLPHQASAIRRVLFERLGLYDADLKIAADYELFLKAIVVHGVTTRHVPAPIAIHVAGGISWVAGPLVGRERRLVQERTLTPVLLEHWEYHVRATQPLAERIRAPFRPFARAVRSWSRRIRGRPDPAA